MEIKTCEQYVLGRLEETERENEILKSRINALQGRNDQLEHRLNRTKDILNKHCVIKQFNLSNDRGIGRYVEINLDEWKTEEADDFKSLVRFAHIPTYVRPEDEDNKGE